MKKNIIRVLTIIIMLGAIISCKNVSNATGEFFDNNKNSIVQVVLTFTKEDGTRYILQTGSGIIINSNTVLTNYHVVHLNDGNMKKAKKLINLGDDNELTPDSIAVNIVKQDDVLISAGITQESEEKDFALLNLAENTDRTPAVLGSSSNVVTAENVMAIGYPTTKPFSDEGAKLFSVSDVNLVSGVVSEVSAGKIKVSGVISAGNSGGALINVGTGELIGLLVYNKEEAGKECFSAIPIDEIKDPYLAGTAYSDNSVAATTEEQSTEEVPEGAKEVDKTMLQQTVNTARALNRDEYTEQSYLFMYDALKDAEHVLVDDNATQDEVDLALSSLQSSKQALTVKEGTNWTLIIIIIVVIVLIVIAVVVVIVMINMKKKEKEKTAFKVLPAENIPVYTSPGAGGYGNSQEIANNNYASQNNDQETTLLNMAGMSDNNNATTVLSNTAPEIVAFLIRKKNGEKKKIDAVEFIIGKDAGRTNYCISDNPTISRCHMKIVKRGMQYFAVDLGSTNHTYVNDAVIPPNQEFEVRNGDRIKVSDEEFTFEL